MTTRTPLFYDCDTGIDDSLALACLLAADNIDLVGVGSVSGNCSAEQGARNTLDLLDMAGRTDVPVAVGAHDRLTHAYGGGPVQVHGDNGVGNLTLPKSSRQPVAESAADLLIRMAKLYPKQLHVVAVGPLTNLALALRKEPQLTSLVAHVTIMGGTAQAPGNVTPVAEANIHGDPLAAAEVFAAPWEITLVGLDVTMENIFEESHRQALLNSGKPLLTAIGQMLSHYFDFYQVEYGRRASALHDPLAAAIAVGLVQLTNAPKVDVVVDATDGPGRGQTICDLRGQRLGPKDQPGAHTRVVLGTSAPLADVLIRQLLGA